MLCNEKIYSVPAIFILLLIPSILSAQWKVTSQFPVNAEDSIRGIDMANQSEGFIAFKTFVGYTTDGAKTYSKRNTQVPGLSGGSFNFQGILTLDDQTAMVFGIYGRAAVILRTTDRGLTWKLVYHFNPVPENNEVGVGISHLQRAGSRIVGLYAATWVVSVDGGLSWTLQYGDRSNVPYTSFAAVDDQLTIAADSDYVYVINPVAGIKREIRTISAVRLVAAPSSKAMYAFRRAFSSYEFYDVQFSNDTGKTWRYQSYLVPLPHPITSWHFINDSTGFAVMGGKIYKTDNYGLVWQLMKGDFEIDSVDKIFIQGASLFSYASGKGPILYSSTDYGGVPYPKAFFKADTVGVGADSIVRLTNYSSRNQQFEWYVNGRKFSTAYHASYKTTRAIRDTVLLIASNATGRDTMKLLVETRYSDGKCIPNFRVLVDTSTVTLTAYDIPDYRLHDWNMGDGTVYNRQPYLIKHQYKKKGTYIIRHEIYDLLNSCIKSQEEMVQILDLTNCDYNPTLTHEKDSFLINKASFNTVIDDYTDYPRATPVHFLWNFGDGDTSSVTNVHTYTKSGTFYVKLEIKYKSCYREAFDTIVINVPDCSARFLSPGPGTRGYNFIAGPVNDPDIKQHTWIFNGKDTMRNTGHIEFSKDIFSHTTADRSMIPCNPHPYAYHSVYNLDTFVRVVKHIVTDNKGCYAEDSVGYPMFGGREPFRLYQEPGHPYTFAFIPYEHQFQTKYFTVEGVDCIRTERAMFYNFKKPGKYVVNMSIANSPVRVYRKTIVVDGEYRYFFLENKNEVTGTIFIDKNGNGIRDAGEPLYKGEAMIKGASKRDTVVVSGSNGIFRYMIGGGDAVTSLQLQKQWYTIHAARTNSTFGDKTDQSDTIHFALQPLTGIADGTISMMAMQQPVAGQRTDYRIDVKNKGLETLRNLELILYRDGKVNIATMQPAPSSITNNMLVWHITELGPGADYVITVRGNILTLPDVKENDTIRWVAKINGISNDAAPSDNAIIYNQLVQATASASQWKNDNQGAYWRTSQADSLPWINYEIHYINKGSDTLFNLDIHDTLADNLDWSTMEMLQASHPYKFFINQKNILNWHFNQILLPGSATNDPASNTWLQFRVKPKSGCKTGDTIINRAALFYDTYLPVFTNNALIHIGDTTVPDIHRSAIQKLYCLEDGIFTFKLLNLPGHPFKVRVKVDDKIWDIDADSTVKIYPGVHGKGVHYMTISYSFRDKEKLMKDTFTFLDKVMPALKLDASTRVITDMSIPLVLTATPANGGDKPLFSYSLWSNFQEWWKREVPENYMNINPAWLALGKCPVYVRMKSNRGCLLQDEITDSIHIIRDKVTGILDPAFPGSEILVYPNPTKGTVNITGLQSSKKYDLEIRDMNGGLTLTRFVSGRTVYSFELTAINGMYLLSIYDSKTRKLLGTQQLLKIR